MAWTVYFTDGVKTESYVWFIEQDDTTAAKVLVDTTGFATGIAVAENGTTIYFGDEQGSLWSVTPSDLGLTQLAALGEDAPIFLEATMYSRTHAVIQCGYYADAPTTAEERGLTLP